MTILARDLAAGSVLNGDLPAVLIIDGEYRLLYVICMSSKFTDGSMVSRLAMVTVVSTLYDLRRDAQLPALFSLVFTPSRQIAEANNR